ncbi:hypothetical protein AB870_16050 [Pandoraea faecigallinarum]|uniref:Type 4b pilus protein PilO2 n=1 Tax=Pandoraea faecigallinarum TaxID=656179 RepID=A0A0H3WSX3_9BURK|nr:type 4b pilus protein PilO2 [Pandoraea faecigallinarum]AKM31314.1 hypothetical protein AB870_16050 [Pandoraea faecigallinarum]
MSLNAPMHIRILGNDVVAGLLWQPPQRQYNAGQIRAAAKELHCSGYVQLKLGNKQLQFALAQRGGSSSGQYSLAAMLSQRVPHANWAGVFELPGGKYTFVCVLGGAIMPGTDLVGDLDDIRLRFTETLDLIAGANKTLGIVYAPEALGAGEWTNERLENLITKSTFVRSVKVRALPGNVSRRGILMALGAASTVAVVAGGGIWWRGKRRDRQMGDIKPAPRIVEVPPPKSWTLSPDARTLSQYWIDTLDNIPYSVAGWTISRVHLAASELLCEYTRGIDGFPEDEFLEGFRRQGGFQVDVDSDGKAVVRRALSIPKHLPRAVATVLTSKELLSKWASRFQRFGVVPPKLESVPPKVPEEGPAGGNERVRLRWATPDWQVFGWSFQTRISPNILFSDFGIPGIELVSLDVTGFSDSGMDWKLEGMVYATAA